MLLPLALLLLLLQPLLLLLLLLLSLALPMTLPCWLCPTALESFGLELVGCNGS